MATEHKRATRWTAAAAAIALCLRLLLPLLHGGAGCDHRAFVTSSGAAVEVCSCGVVHTHGGDLLPGGGLEEGAPASDSPCLACQWEDESPGGAPLCLIRAPAHAPAPAGEARAYVAARVATCCPRPPSRAPPGPPV